MGSDLVNTKFSPTGIVKINVKRVLFNFCYFVICDVFV